MKVFTSNAIKVTDQGELFLPWPDMEQFVGVVDSHGIEYLNRPKWDPTNKRWVCLANVHGMLALVSVNITYSKGTTDA